MTWGLNTEHAAYISSITIVDTTVWVTWRVTGAIICERNGPYDVAMNPNISHGQIKCSPKVQSMNRAVVSGYYKIKDGCQFQQGDKKCTRMSEIE